MGCGEECPYVPGVERDDWALPDPKGRPLDEVRAIRDDIRGTGRGTRRRARLGEIGRRIDRELMEQSHV